MESLIYFFSKFTSEILLFEAFFIFLAVSAYSAFWFLRKRKFGSLDQAVPSSVVKQYLTSLIEEAHLIRTQLFGLLNQSQSGVAASGTALETNVQQLLTQFQNKAENASAALSGSATASPSSDPALTQKLAALEAKLAEQTSAMNSVVTEKERLAQELAALKLKEPLAASGGQSSTGSGADVDALKSQIKNLEGRLAEYSVIEDDLANLKRLQQENAQLKSALSGATAAPPAAAAAAAPIPTAATALAGAIAASPPSFEGLVDQVEESLQQTPPPEEVAQAQAQATPTEPLVAEAPVETPADPAPVVEAVAPPTPTPAPASSAPPVGSTNAAPAEHNAKNDEDLLSEFEKMLNI